MFEQHPILQERQQPEAGAELERLPDLWDATFGEQQGYLALFSGRRADRRLHEPQERFFVFPADAARAASWVRREAGRHRELYQCVHLLTIPRRRKEDAAPLTSLYADIDHDQLGDAIPEPTVLVQSSPGKLQGYWRLSEPVSPARGEALNRRLAASIGADASGWDLTQLLRVPGTRNWKYPDAPAVQLVHLSEARYAPNLFEQLLVPLPERPMRRPRSDRGARARSPVPVPATEPPLALTRPARAVWEGQDVKYTQDGLVDRSASLVRIARVLLEAGMKSEAIVTALAERDLSLGWGKYSGRGDAWERYQAIVEVVVQGTRTRRRQG